MNVFLLYLALAFAPDKAWEILIGINPELRAEYHSRLQTGELPAVFRFFGHDAHPLDIPGGYIDKTAWGPAPGAWPDGFGPSFEPWPPFAGVASGTPSRAAIIVRKKPPSPAPGG